MYVLILMIVLYNSHPTLTTATFETARACEFAGKIAVKDFSNQDHVVTYKCVPQK